MSAELLALLRRISGLTLDQDHVLRELVVRSRTVAELRAGLKWTRRRVVDVLVALERRGLVAREDERAPKMDERVYGLAPGFLEHAGAEATPWRPTAEATP